MRNEITRFQTFGSREARARCSGWGRKSESATDTTDTTPLTPYLEFDNFWRIFVKLQRTPYLKNCHFWRKMGKLRRTPYFKTGQFRRKFVKICEIEAHSLFQNWPVSTKIGENLWNWGALLIWKRAFFDENWWNLLKLRRTPSLKTCNFRRKLVKISEIEADSSFEN